MAILARVCAPQENRKTRAALSLRTVIGVCTGGCGSAWSTSKQVATGNTQGQGGGACTARGVAWKKPRARVAKPESISGEGQWLQPSVGRMRVRHAEGQRHRIRLYARVAIVRNGAHSSLGSASSTAHPPSSSVRRYSAEAPKADKGFQSEVLENTPQAWLVQYDKEGQ
ncbi:hypothetical protein C8R44DRAFT_730381 [Mycena epipterygia]|nr:hypothetical protein C8R44DRAFT_730381 [Mycena epipterygia]